MKSFHTANQNATQDATDSLNGIGPTTAQTQGAPALTWLYCDNSRQLTQLPDTIGQDAELQLLDVDNSQLTQLPDTTILQEAKQYKP